jgi:hypothetical protein
VVGAQIVLSPVCIFFSSAKGQLPTFTGFSKAALMSLSSLALDVALVLEVGVTLLD